MYGTRGARGEVSTMTNVPRSVNVTRGWGAPLSTRDGVWNILSEQCFPHLDRTDTNLYVNYGFFYSDDLKIRNSLVDICKQID